MGNKYGPWLTPQNRAAFARVAAELEKLRGIVAMDNKYGYLFTADDMIAFALIVAQSEIDVSVEPDAIDELLDNFEGRFPKEEPLFLVRGQDRRALNCVRNYRTMITYSGSTEPDPKLAKGLDAVVAQFEDFREAYPDRMNDPD